MILGKIFLCVCVQGCDPRAWFDDIKRNESVTTNMVIMVFLNCRCSFTVTRMSLLPKCNRSYLCRRGWLLSVWFAFEWDYHKLFFVSFTMAGFSLGSGTNGNAFSLLMNMELEGSNLLFFSEENYKMYSWHLKSSAYDSDLALEVWNQVKTIHYKVIPLN